jgi:hypothetical protein
MPEGDRKQPIKKGVGVIILIFLYYILYSNLIDNVQIYFLFLCL